ncbi:MAG: NifB/NifX family molybdenum-iron cluster-binding protein [Armatimonadetes bacterium]|nr:NifB/NifX family molybdenum-iron cluster-binding protein [Armatimonadota bacterium]
MRIAITARGPTLDADVDPRFGRCAYFLIIDPGTMEFEAIENPNAGLGGGAGIQSAQLMATRDVKFVLTGSCGPNAHDTLSAVGIGVIPGCSGAAREAVERFKAGQLNTASEPNVASHSGMAEASSPLAGPVGPAGGAGMGRGPGGGRGMGRGMGKGMGRGGGQGRGRGGGGAGQGRGRGRGMGG